MLPSLHTYPLLGLIPGANLPPLSSLLLLLSQMEVGIEDCLHIEFEYDKARYHMQDVVVGRIHFLLVGGDWT